jgi:hypothetical protein
MGKRGNYPVTTRGEKEIDMDNKCCGSVCMTKFCPNCGQATSESMPLVSLLLHVRSTVNARRKEYESGFTSETQPPNGEGWHPDYYPKHRAKLQRQIAKWGAWEKALVDAINNSPLDNQK